MPNYEQIRDSRNEEEFFHNLERELLRKWRRRAETERELNELSAATGIVDRDILLDLQNLDLEPDTALLLRIVPLLQVAWSDGSINSQERQRIAQIAEGRGLDRDHSAWRKLSHYLEEQPADEFFRVALRALRASLETAPTDEQDRCRRELLADCTSVALAAGGLLGIRRMSEAERLVINEIAEALGID
jgi:uncharacterized tellurite resistance protein B-like protein/uncharacterized protein YjiS (DUF1127 family)